ncbi:hypothetical protein B5X24_HaOG207109 [Helicoverpa armigera]|uniref:Uncharacterized protein n=1 Tax=Helicoverpa armigera TaxID=29058 RepID=A0A2W1BMJ6_HELAM|nr:hypothetical protein B5X24_HaOG207109 [Helicoverpa armigera]
MRQTKGRVPMSYITKEMQPAKEIKEQYEKVLHMEQHAEQPVGLHAIGSGVQHDSGETGPNINVNIAQQDKDSLEKKVLVTIDRAEEKNNISDHDNLKTDNSPKVMGPGT